MRWSYSLLAACLATGLAFAVPAVPSVKARDEGTRCVHLDGSIAELRLKLRMGYSAKQGRVYRQKLATLEVERKTLCP